jgi:hypothetical protein
MTLLCGTYYGMIFQEGGKSEIDTLPIASGHTAGKLHYSITQLKPSPAVQTIPAALRIVNNFDFEP